MLVNVGCVVSRDTVTPRTDLVETRLSFFCSVGFLFLSCISIVVFNFLIATALPFLIFVSVQGLAVVFVCVCFLRGVFCAQGGRAGLVLKSAAVTG